MFDLQGKSAFITGGSAGIGLAVAKRFRNAGATVMIADIVDGEVSATAMGASFVKLDVSDEQSVDAALKTAIELAGPLDIVVNNAGITGADNFKPIDEADLNNFDRVLGINLKGVFHGLKHAPAVMNDCGSIINTASLAAFYAVPGNSQYSATKAAVVSMTQIAALELGSRGIRVNAVCPSFFRTAMGGSDMGEAIANEMTALGRIGEVEELVGVYHFLAADESRYLTGQAIVVDGGMNLGITSASMTRVIGEVTPSKPEESIE